ncbi:MAG: chemotaxis protein CheW [Thermoanaerobaculia bacterium]
MVDLVKLRKKAKEQEARVEASRQPDTSPEAVGTEAPVGQPASPLPPVLLPHSSIAAQPLKNAGSPPPAVEAFPAGPSKLERFKEIAGKRREGLVHQVALSEEGHLIEVLTFAIAGEHYAAGIERVVEIIPIRDVTRVPNAERSVRGIISLRGTIVTIMDARARLGHPSAGSGPDSRIIVVGRGSETLGFEVDRVLRVVKVEASEIQPQPVVHASEEREPIRGIFRQAAALTILLDLDKLLA